MCLKPKLIDFDQVIEIISSKIKNQEYSNRLLETKTLGRCMFSSLLSLIRSAYLLAFEKEYLGFSVINRSIVEHLVDFRLITLSNNEEVNRQFINYYKLIRYWNRKWIENKTDDLERCDKEYNDFIFDHHQDLIKKFRPNNTNSLIVSSKEINKYLKGKYSKSWSGKTFNDRRSLIKEKSQATDRELFDVLFEKTFVLMSQYTHPTPFSSIPNFNFKNLHFEKDYNKTRFNVDNANKLLALFSLLAIRSYAICLNGDSITRLSELIIELYEKFPKFEDVCKLTEITQREAL